MVYERDSIISRMLERKRLTETHRSGASLNAATVGEAIATVREIGHDEPNGRIKELERAEFVIAVFNTLETQGHEAISDGKATIDVGIGGNTATIVSSSAEK